MKKMDRYKRRNLKASCSPPCLNLKRSYTGTTDGEEHVEHYLKNEELKLNQIKYYTPKSVNIVRRKITAASPVNAKQVISLNSDMIMDGETLAKKGKKDIVQNSPVTTNTNGNNDRLVIELSDYLTLTKTKHIGKFNLKPITTSKCDEVNPLSPIDKIIQTANAVKLDQVLKGGQLSERKVDNSNQESQRTFLLVPQKVAHSMDKKSEECQKQVIKMKSKAKVLQSIEQNDHQNSSTHLSNILAGSDNFFIKIPVANQQEATSPVLEIPSNYQTKVIKKIQRDRLHSHMSDDTVSLKGKKKMNVVLRTHPYFSQHKPFIIKHQPSGAKVVKHQSYSVTNQQGNLLNSELNIVSISDPSNLVDEIKCEIPEQDLNIMTPQENESINQVFPVALKSTDSDDFEYLGLEDNNEILTESEMQILGI